MTIHGGAAAEQPPVLDDIVRGIERTDRLLFMDSESFRIVFAREKSESLGPKGNFARTEWVVAHKGNKWLVEQRFLPPYLDDEQEGRRVHASDGAKTIDWTLSNRMCGVFPFGDGRNMYIGSTYSRFMGLDANRYIAASGGADYDVVRNDKHRAFDLDHPFQPETVQRNVDQYRVLSQPEEVEGCPCWVVEWPDMDRMWIDVAHGFSIRRRLYHWGPGKPLKYGILQSDFREVKPGLWLPHTQIVDQYAHVPLHDEAYWGKVVNRSTYVVREIEFDDISDSLFEVNLPAGTRVFDMVHNVRYTTAADGSDPFDDASMEEARKRGHSTV